MDKQLAHVKYLNTVCPELNAALSSTRLAEFMLFDHSAYGVLMVIALYYAMENKLLTSVWIFILTVLFSLQYIYLGGFSNPGWYIVLFYLFTIPLINLYNGKKGLSNFFTKWFFYIFYPAHITLLVILKSIIWFVRTFRTNPDFAFPMLWL